MDSCFEGDVFVLRDYNQKPPFSGLLPGVAGPQGVPLWCFYVSRGQCVASFGADERDGAMMEYVPAAAAYEDTARKGFRTFISCGGCCFEPFSPSDENQEQELRISRAALELRAMHRSSGIEVRVEYRTLPGEDIGALMRRVTIRNTGCDSITFRLADGMARIIPAGIRNTEFREMSNLLKSYFDAEIHESGAALFSSRSTTENTARVGAITRRNFYFASSSGCFLKLVCDPTQLFGPDTGLGWPSCFFGPGFDLEAVPSDARDVIPCAMALGEFSLGPGGETVIDSFVGCADGAEQATFYTHKFADKAWCDGKHALAESVVEKLSSDLELETAQPLFDAYLRQCLLDNTLRGGRPVMLAGKLLHLYGRRHGDLERDYNYFRLQATHYSQGDGNFRDICQNRRSDVLLFPEVGEREVLEFLGLIQLDGYNPLEVYPMRLVLRPERRDAAAGLLRGAERVIEKLSAGLSVGELWRELRASGYTNSYELISELCPLCDYRSHSEFGDGYWIDHWTYVPELVENYLKIYPEFGERLLFFSRIGWPEIGARVLPMRERLIDTGHDLRQYEAVKSAVVPAAEVPEASVYAKLFFLAALKCATLDQRQAGLEMEAGKPGWNDALNGLPGLFGSSSSECADLLLLLQRLRSWCSVPAVEFPSELIGFVRRLSGLLREFDFCSTPSLEFWRVSLKLREEWRARVYSGKLCGGTETVKREELLGIICGLETLVQNGLRRARNGSGLLDTYFVNKPLVQGARLSEDDITAVVSRPLPLFLEGQAKLMRVSPDEAAGIHFSVENSELYDRELKMYRLCAPLHRESPELGRITAFTPGIFERESIFPHAESKYLLSMLDVGLYEELFERMRTVLPPFFDPEIYGRSTLENSSYIASSANPDPELAGRGFVGRLSGAAAEAITLCLRMFLGDRLFCLDSGELTFAIEPALPDWLFREDGTLSFRYLGCRFIYINRSRRNIYGPDSARQARISCLGQEIPAACLPYRLACQLREKKLEELTVIFE